jgi:cystathionine beta-lyase family protein involved in aluminum resistance
MRIEENYNVRRIVEALINQLVADKKIEESTARNIIDIGRSSTLRRVSATATTTAAVSRSEKPSNRSQ